MIERGAVAGLSLVCALLSCAFAAQSAFAIPAPNTTAFTCVFGGGSKDFTDAHCDQKVSAGSGSYGHVAIPLGEKTELELTNAGTKNSTGESTPAVIKGTVFGVATEIVCSKVADASIVIEKKLIHSASVQNEEDIFGEHTVKGQATLRFASCKVQKPALGCTVKEPLDSEILEFQGREGLGAGKNEMGVQFNGGGPGIFMTVAIEGCLIKGTYKVEGTAVATGTPAPTEKHSGATTVFTNAMTKETLKLAGNPAELSASITARRAGGNPIAFTTPT
jgi:hypothetical protein